jgi:hypothetical protein
MERNNNLLRREEIFPVPVYEDQNIINDTDFHGPGQNRNRHWIPPKEYDRIRDIPVSNFPPRSKRPIKRKDKFRNR